MVSVWHSFAPSNAKAFAWRCILDRIASGENLLKRNVLGSVSDASCRLCPGLIESCSHLIFTCPFASAVWKGCFNWFGLDTVLPHEPRPHYLQFLFGWNNTQNVILSSIWVAAVWSLWLQRNDRIFNGGQQGVSETLELVKWRAWQWIKVRRRGFCYSWFEWLNNP